MKKVFIADGQLFQSLAFHRGIGKYSLSLLEELDKVPNEYTSRVLVLNDSGMSESDLELIQLKIPTFSVIKLPLHRAGIRDYRNYSAIEAQNKHVLDNYVTENFNDAEVDFLILSLFQETECPTFPSLASKKSVIVYDLIPLQFPQIYLHSDYVEKTYLSRFKVFYEADHFYTISETVANDLTVHLGIPINCITPILGAQIKRKSIKSKSIKSLEDERYVLLPSGDDHRKNNRRAVLAFNEFNRKNGSNHKLVITSFFNDRAQAELSAYCDSLVFTGNVPESELSWLYENTEAVLFPSEYEGLGMPVMEAVEFGKPVICSDIAVFREIHNSAFSFCDPYDVDSIEESLNEVLSGVWNIDTKAYKAILKYFSWGKTARLLQSSLDSMSLPLRTENKPKIAIFAPTPSGYSAIGKVVQEQHYALSRIAKVDYYLEQGFTERAHNATLRKNILPYIAESINPWEYTSKTHDEYDRTIFHIGNSEYHIATLARSLAFPDTLVLHDTNIEGLYNVSNVAQIISTERVSAEKHLNELNKNKNGNYLTSIISGQRKIIVHSEYAKQAVKDSNIGQLLDDLTVAKELPTPVPYALYKPKTKDIVVSLAGIVHEAKGIDIIKKIADTNIKGRNITVKIFGFSLLSKESKNDLLEASNIRFVDSPSDTRFLHELVRSDVVINFRSNYHGETSLSTLEAIRQGKAVVVNNTGWFGELPDNVAIKINDQSEIVDAILRALEHETPTVEAARRDYIKRNHSIEDYVKVFI